MPLRVKSLPLRQSDHGPRSPSPFNPTLTGSLPNITQSDSFREVVKKLSVYITDIITRPNTFEQLRTTQAGDGLRQLVEHLSTTCTNPCIVNALLALKWHYITSSHDDKGLNEARANSCEIVAWRFLTHLNEREVVQYCLYEIPNPLPTSRSNARDVESVVIDDDNPDEYTSLLGGSPSRSSSPSPPPRSFGSGKRSQLLRSLSRLTTLGGDDADQEDDPTASFTSLNALEIAAIASAKRFLSQHVVQTIITGIWKGDIIFWDQLSVHATKRPTFFDPHTADPFSRLRVPRYLKAFEVMFFVLFLCLYYAVLVERNPYRISTLEIMLYVWFSAFAYDELVEWIDAGSIFYVADLWNVFDLVMLAIGAIFAGMRIIGLSNNDPQLIDLAFDVLSLEALFMIPRICSFLSLSPYWGTLIPCIKEMGKDFVKFMVLVVIIYLGFLTTFSLVGRKSYSLEHMSMILTKIFFGSSYVGFDVMDDIDHVFGPPLMFLFITLSSILLMGSLTGMLSNSFSRVITRAREEYLFVYSVYVLEASTSNRLTHFYPPLNLIALVLFRPLRLFLLSHAQIRAARIMLLKVTHLPIVGIIMLFEYICARVKRRRPDRFATFRGLSSNARNCVSLNDITTTNNTSNHNNNNSNNFNNNIINNKSADPPGHKARPGVAGLHMSIASQPGPPTHPRRHSSTGAPHLSARWHSRALGGATAAAAAATATAEDEVTESSADIEDRIAQLSSKIDRLTEIVLEMQKQGQAHWRG